MQVDRNSKLRMKSIVLYCLRFKEKVLVLCATQVHQWYNNALQTQGDLCTFYPENIFLLSDYLVEFTFNKQTRLLVNVRRQRKSKVKKSLLG